jgi:hypothetical protein
MGGDNGNHCYECAFKHLAEVRVLLGEMLRGWNDARHRALAIGNLAQAERHLALHPDLANRIRHFRRIQVAERFDGRRRPPDLPDDAAVAGLFAALDDCLEEVLDLEDRVGELGPEPGREPDEPGEDAAAGLLAALDGGLEKALDLEDGVEALDPETERDHDD